MSFLLSLFRSEKAPDDETVLASLARDIARQQALLVDLRARERAISTRITLYLLAPWLAYLGVWYFGFVSGGSAKPVERAVRALPLFVLPIVILFFRRIVQMWYARKDDAVEKTLQTLLNDQRAKVEDIKKKTNFYETYELLSRHGGSFSGLPSPSGDGNANGGGARGESVSIPNTPQRGGPRLSMVSASAAPPPSAFAAHHQQQYRIRGWFDLLADVLVGPGDTPQVDKKKKPKHALVCAKCCSHNGLVPQEGVQFTCPTCGHFNPSPRRRGPARGAAPPSSQPSALSQTSPSPRSPPSISHGEAPQGRGGAEAPVPVSSGDSAASGGEAPTPTPTQTQALPRRRGAQTQAAPQRGEGQTQAAPRNRAWRRSARGAAGGGQEEVKVDS